MLLNLIHIVLGIISLNNYANANDRVTNLISNNQTKTTIDLSWINPDIYYDSLILKYEIKQENRTIDKSLTYNQTFYTITNLKPGSILLITISTIVNNTELAVSDSISIISLLDEVTRVFNVDADTNNIIGKFIIPDGYFTVIAFRCASTSDENIKFDGFASPGSNFFTCYNLQAGYNYSIVFVTFEKSFSSIAISDKFYANTNLDKAIIGPVENPSGQLDLNLIKPNGNYDYIEIKVQLISSDALGYYTIDKSLVNKCVIGSGQQNNYTLLQNVDFKMTDLCMLSVYNISVSTYLEGFNTVTESETILTEYGNVDCDTLSLETIGNKTTLTWIKPNFNLRNYSITITDTSIQFSNQTIISYNITSIEYYNLFYEHEYLFTFVTNAIVKDINQKLVDASSLNCSKVLKTGPACPTISNPPELLYAPYTNNVTISVDINVFTSSNLIYFIDVYVGEETDCVINNFTKTNCYKALRFEINDFYLLNSTLLYLNLSTESVCNLTNSFCNKQFTMDKAYYVSLKLTGKCGEANSNSLKIVIPTPFPLGSAIAITIGITMFIIIVLLTTVLSLTCIHIKNRHIEEIEYLLTNQPLKESTSNVTGF